MSFCRKVNKNNNCGNNGEKLDSRRDCDAFSLCLPFGRSLIYDGECLRLEGGATVADGVYGKFKVVDGCLTEALPDEVPSYTPPPCTPAPTPCGGGTEAASLTPSADNLLFYDSAGRLMGKLFVENGTGIQISGTGTEGSPLKITGTIEPNDTKITSSTPDALPIEGLGTESRPYDIRHAVSKADPGSSFGGFTVDRYGHIQGYQAPDSPGIITLQGTPGEVEAAVTQGAAVLSLAKKFQNPQSFQAGEQKVEVDLCGRISAITDSPAPVNDRFSNIFTGNRTFIQFVLTTGRSGRLRISYQGDLGLELAGAGLAPLPAAIGLTLDGMSIAAYAVLSNGRVAGLEAVSVNAYEAGDHLIAISLPEAVSAPGIMDVSICQ